MLKLIKPVTSSLRHLKRITHNSLNKKVLIKKRLKLKKKSVGKNNVGGIVVYHKGGGHKQRFREIDFKRKHLFGIVCSIEYDPFRTSYIASVFDFNVEQHFYILSPKNLLVGDIINSGDNVKPKLGNLLKFRDLPLGSIIHNVELNRNSGAKLIRSAGCFGQLIQKYKKHARIKLCSGKIILILLNCYAVVGRLSNETHHMGCVGKAGRNRWLNKRPTVRGVAMNPVDHPNGGGEGKKSGKKNSISPWGKLSKGTSTKKKYIYTYYL